MTNNFDISSSGVNLELYIMRDSDIARTDFEENFVEIENTGSVNIYQFISCGTFEEMSLSDPDCYKITKQELKQALIDDIYDDIDELREDCRFHCDKSLSKMNKQDFFDMLGSLYDSSFLAKFYKTFGIPRFKVIPIHGYCQGDYAEIVFMERDMKEYSFNNIDTFLSNMREYFTNLFYNQPIYARLEIDEEEIYLDEYLENVYDYEPSQIIDGLKKNLTHDKKDYIINWVEQKLPEYVY